MLDRTLDRHHQAVYHRVDRERVRYLAPRSRLSPTLDHMLVWVRKLAEGRIDDVAVADDVNVARPKKPESWIEPVLFEAAVAAYCAGAAGASASGASDEIAALQQRRLASIRAKWQTAARAAPAPPSAPLAPPNNAPEILASLGADPLLPFAAVLEECVRLLGQMGVAGGADLGSGAAAGRVGSDSGSAAFGVSAAATAAYLRSLTSPSVRAACEALANLTRIPAPLLADILLRTPMTRQEYLLQLQIWTEFQPQLQAAHRAGARRLRACLDNLVFYGVEYDAPRLARDVLPAAFAHPGPLGETAYLNRLIWLLGHALARHGVRRGPHVAASIAAAQETAVKQLGGGARAGLLLQGYLGIILAIRRLSPSRARRLLDIAELRRRDDDPPATLIAYHVTKITLADTPDQLLYAFNTAAEDHRHSATVWLAFVNKLDELGLLNERRSLQVLSELMAIGGRVLVTKDLVLALLRPVRRLDAMERFVAGLGRLAAAHASLVVPKQLRLLYASAGSGGGGGGSGEAAAGAGAAPSNRAAAFGDTADASNRAAAFGDTAGASNRAAAFGDTAGASLAGASALEAARATYHQHPRKTVSIVGIMLLGEAAIQPQRLYLLYQRELGALALQPNEECLRALIRAATSATMLWGDMYAPQVAAHEFAAHVMRSSDGTGVYPSDTLWSAYVGMLAQFDYTRELLEVMAWWEALEFVPSADLLLQLLAALPAGFGERHIRHVEAAGASALELRAPTAAWPWPTVDQLAAWRT